MKLRKTMALFLSAVLLTTLAFGLTAQAVVNILPNADMSVLDENGYPFSISGMTDSTAEVRSISNAAVNGNRELVVTKPTGTDNIYIGLWWSGDGFIAGQTYTYSFKYKTTDAINPLWNFASGSTFDYSESSAYFHEPWTAKAATWTEFTTTFTMPANKAYVHLCVRIPSNRQGTFEFADFAVMGVRKPATEAIEGDEKITNGGFTDGTTGWTLSGAEAATEDGNTYISVPTQGAAATASFTVGTDKVYALSVDVKSAVDNAAKVWIGNADSVTNIASGDFFFNRYVNYGYTYAATGGEWKTIKFNIFPSDYVQTVTVSLQCAADDAALSFDNLSVKPTKELLGNGSFEGITPTALLAGDGMESTINMPGWSPESNKISYTAAGAYNGTSAKLTYDGGEPFLTHMARVEAGKTYKLSGQVYTTTNEGMPGFYGILSNSLTGLSYNNNGRMTSAQSELSIVGLSPTATNGWYAFEKYITIPTTYTPSGWTESVEWPTREMNLAFRFRQNKSNGNYYLLDDLSLQEVKEGAEFYNDAGVKLSTLPRGENVNVYFNYFSQETESEDVTMIAALYALTDGVPCLVRYTLATGSASVQTPGTICGTVAIPDSEADYKLAAFCMDSPQTLRALAPKTELR